jgi:hypothetical protein
MKKSNLTKTILLVITGVIVVSGILVFFLVHVMGEKIR